MKQEDMLALYFPHSGEKDCFTTHYTLGGLRRMFPNQVWTHNPFTGKKRDQRDIDTDKQGLLIVAPAAPLEAAES